MTKETGTYDLAIIGGGVVGLATAYRFQQKFPEKKLIVFEKEKALAHHQTGRNSGVIHSGVYYKPGSYKARLCVEGRRQLSQYAAEKKVPHDICGKIILATKRSELPALEKIYQRGLENGIEGLHYLDPPGFKEIEPYADGVKAIRVPVTGIIDYSALCRSLWQDIERINPQSKLVLNAQVKAPRPGDSAELIHSSQGDFRASFKIFCAGLQSDRMAAAHGVKQPVRIVGFRGDYYRLSERGKHKVKHLIYPVPDPSFPFLGVHFTRMTDGSVECGPNAVFSFKREGYSKTAFDWQDSMEALGFKGTWRLFLRHPGKGIDEYRRAFSKKRFLRALKGMIPSLEMSDIEPERSGVRAQALAPDGGLVDDFAFAEKANTIHVINAPSPAATACLAIGEEILARYLKKVNQ